MQAQRQTWVIVWGLALAGAVVGARQAPPPGRGAADPRIGIEAFEALRARGQAEVIDVRVAASFQAGHIPGAVNVQLDEVGRRAPELHARANGRVIVFYCSCPEEHASLAAVRLLDAHGVPGARALAGGYPAWIARHGGRGGYLSSAACAAMYARNASSDSTVITPRMR